MKEKALQIHRNEHSKYSKCEDPKSSRNSKEASGARAEWAKMEVV